MVQFFKQYLGTLCHYLMFVNLGNAVQLPHNLINTLHVVILFCSILYQCFCFSVLFYLLLAKIYLRPD